MARSFTRSVRYVAVGTEWEVECERESERERFGGDGRPESDR